MPLTAHDGGYAAYLRDAPSPRRAADLWWLNPTLIVVLLVLPIYLAIQWYDFSRVVRNVYVPSPLYVFGVVLIGACAVGAQWALSHRRTGPALVPPRISFGVMLLLLLPTLAAYAIWFGPLLTRPHLLVEVATGQRAEVRDAISTIPGVTTFTQLGVAYAIAYAIKSGAGTQRIHAVERVGLVLVIALAIFRAFAWAERLALIEVMVCFAVARLAYLPVASSRRWRLIAVLPAIGPLVLYGLFTASEYFRSWEFYKKDFSSVWTFTLDRLITYYATAVNNGIGALVEIPGWPYYTGSYVLDWPYIMPGLSSLMVKAFGNPHPSYNEFLEIYARPEFNSPTAFFRAVIDLGYAGSVIFFLAVGYVIGRAYIGFRRGHIFGLLAYPVCVLFLIESLRYSYLSETRIVPLTIGLIAIGLDIRRSRRGRTA